LLIAQCLAQKTSQTNVGDRKIGIVIDESNSMQDNDPNNTRIDAALALNEGLISLAEKSSTQTPDQVAIIGFHDDPDLLYPLGDPQGASGIIRNISSAKSGTFIGGGIGAAINETTKQGTGATADRTGIVVLTDGLDNTSGRFGTQGTIDSILRAGSLGIRVSFGFLSRQRLQQDRRILLECLRTGGIFSTFSNPESMKNFIEQVERQGITNKDGQGLGKFSSVISCYFLILDMRTTSIMHFLSLKEVLQAMRLCTFLENATDTFRCCNHSPPWTYHLCHSLSRWQQLDIRRPGKRSLKLHHYHNKSHNSITSHSPRSCQEHRTCPPTDNEQNWCCHDRDYIEARLKR
jgi:hypothetical protein